MESLILNSERIEELAAADISDRFTKSRDFWKRATESVTNAVSAELSEETSAHRADLRQHREQRLTDAKARIDRNTDETIERAKADAEKAAKDKLTREIGRRWGSLSNIATEEWIRTEMRAIIREHVKQAFGRTAHQLARAAHYIGMPKYKPKTYRPPIRNIRLYRLEEMEGWSLPQEAYDQKYAELEDRRQKRIADSKERRRKEFEKLQAEFGGGA